SLVPLSTFTQTPAPPPPDPLGTAPGTPQEVGTVGGGAFFDELGDALAVNPPASDADKAALARFAALGIGAGKHPDALINGGALDKGVSDGMAEILDAAGSSATSVNGWIVHLDIDKAGADPLLRAAVANFAWGANVPEEALYAASSADPAREPYTGAKAYL